MGKTIMEKLVGWDKEKEITYQLLSQSKYTQFGEKWIKFIAKQAIDFDNERQSEKTWTPSYHPPCLQSQFHPFISSSSILTPSHAVG